MRTFWWLLGVCLLSACTSTPISPAEQVARDYTQAFLRRSVEEMKSMSLSDIKAPTPRFAMSHDKVIRLCPPEPAKGPEAQRILVLFGSPEAIRFSAMLVIVGHYGAKWLVSKADLVKTEQGQTVAYSRTCRSVGEPGA